MGSNKPEQVFYIVYRKDGALIEEKAGRQFQDDLTAARLRAQKIEGDQPTNKERRRAKWAAKEAEDARWTVARLWAEYKTHKANSKALRTTAIA